MKIYSSFRQERHIAPLVILRIAFGAIMFISTVRFVQKGWIKEFYVKPIFHFTFYGFDWVKPLSEGGMYLLFGIMALACLGIMIGFRYRISAITFFASFLYVELLDKTCYLNHYYLVSLFAFLLILVPANRYFSLDVLIRPSLGMSLVPAWTITIFKLQLLIVYFFAGVSKINSDWLMEAMPLRIWLPAQMHLPVIGHWLTEAWVAYFFSWFGAAFDLSIGFLLLNGKTRGFAYFFVVIFHLLTALFFKIGMFPYIMMAVTIIFFSEEFHVRLIERLSRLIQLKKDLSENYSRRLSPFQRNFIFALLTVYFTLQFTIPFRYCLYPGQLFWTEEGYRFSWRVMLIEKAGTAFFNVENPETKTRIEIINSWYLTSMQEKMMATQPDMILQYAHFIAEEYKKSGIKNPIVTVQSYVTLNGGGSRPFVDPSVDLSREEESFLHKDWILSPNEHGMK